MTEDHSRRPSRPSRPDSREVVELKQLKTDQPELGSAVDLQLALLDLQRRVQSRVPMAWVKVDAALLEQLQARGKPLLRFEDIPLDWTDFRLAFRQTADILRRFDALEDGHYGEIQTLSRAGHTLDPLVVRWFELKAGMDRAARQEAIGQDAAHTLQLPPALGREAFEQVVQLAMRPFLERCSDIVQQRADFSGWHDPYCPMCGGEPEMGLITQAAERLLICGRCAARWRYHPHACPYCQNAERTLITSFASRDGRYRIYACDVCQRYLKAYDSRQANRPMMVAVESIATLPLDAAAMQRGYTS